MQSIKERTQLFVKSKGIKMVEFERRCNLSTGYVSSMRKGFGDEKLNNVLKAFPELNREWLLYGEGEMFNKEENSNKDITTEDSVVIPLPVWEMLQAQVNSLAIRDKQIDELIKLLNEQRKNDVHTDDVSCVDAG